MAIYASGHLRVNFVTARLVPVWVEKKPADIKWHYSEPKRVGKRSKVRREDIWHVTAEYAEASKDGSCRPGMKLYGGREEPIFPGFKADGGIREILDECYRINPGDAERYLVLAAA